MERRGFLRLFGLGAAAVATLPVEELIDRLAFARSPTTSVYVPTDYGAGRALVTIATRDFRYFTGGLVPTIEISVDEAIALYPPLS